MTDKKVFKLEQTKGSDKLQGIIVGKNEKSYSEGEDKNNNPYKSIRFGLKTSPTNIIPVELYASAKEFVYPYSKDEGKTLKVEFNKRNDGFPKGYHIIGTSISLPNEEKKYDRTNYVEYDAVDVINKQFNDNDSVYISGEIVANQYADQSGEMQDKPKFSIKSIKKYINPINFDDEKYTEMASFEQEIVIEDTHDNANENLVEVNARVILYADKYKNIKFVIDKKETEKLANKFLKLKFGDFISVQGVIETIELAPVEDEDDWGSKRPKGFNATKNSRNRLVITAVSEDKNGDAIFKAKKYKLEDFDTVEDTINNDEVNFNDLPKENKSKQNIAEEIDDDEVPF